jgi:hypothetical protein
MEFRRYKIMGIISNKPVTVASAILAEAGETLSSGDLVSMVDNKLYELPRSLDTMTTVLNFTRNSSNSYVGNAVVQGGAKILTVFANSSGYPEARLYEISDVDGIKQTGTAFVINAAVANFIKIFKLSEELVLVYYTTGSSGTAVSYVCLLKITGSTMSVVGSAVSCLGTGLVYPEFNLLSYDGTAWRVLLIAKGYDTSIYSGSQVLRVTTSGITVGSFSSLSTYTTILKVAILSENNYILTYYYGSSTTQYLRAYTISNVTVTAGGVTNISTTANGTNADIIKIDNTRCYYRYQSDNTFFKHRIVTVSGTTITLGTEYQFNTGVTPSSTYIVDTDKVLFIYVQSSVYYAKILTINDTVIDTTASAIAFSNALVSYVERYGNKYLVNGLGTHLLSISGTDINLTLVTNYAINSFQSFSPFKNFSFTIDQTTAANSKAFLYFFPGLLQPTGYVVSDSRFVSNTMQKAAYMPF